MGTLLLRALLASVALGSVVVGVGLMLRVLRGAPNRGAVRCAACGADLDAARRQRRCSRCGAGGEVG